MNKIEYYVHAPKYPDGLYHALLFKNSTFIKEICETETFEDCFKQAYIYMNYIFLPNLE